MSAETLREAARRIQHDVDFGQANGDDAFLLSVAEWLVGESLSPSAWNLAALNVASAYLSA